MLKFLQKKKVSKRILIALATIIIPAFGLWGIGAALRDKGKSVLSGKVFGKTVRIQEFAENYKAIKRQYLLQFGRDQLGKLEKYLDLESQTWDRIILLAEAKKRRVRVTDKEVIGYITQTAAFQRNGKFDPVLYQETAKYFLGAKPREFEEEIRNNLTIAKLYQQSTQQITIAQEEVKQAHTRENEQISLDYICALSKDYLEKISLADDELLQYYNQNSARFKQPLSYNIEYLALGNQDKQTINKVSASLKQDSGFEEIAQTLGLPISETGLFSHNEPIPKIGWSTEILRVLPKLNPDDKPWPLAIPSGEDSVYFVRLKEEKIDYIPAFEKVKPEVNQLLLNEKVSQLTLQEMNSARERIEQIGLSKAASKLKLSIQKTGLFKRQGYLEGLGDPNIFFDAVENLKIDEISQVINTNTGSYIVKLTDRVKPSDEEFEKKKKELTAALLENKKQIYFKEFLAELKNTPNTFMFVEQSSPGNP